MSVCLELHISPFEALKMYFDKIDCLGIVSYYDEIVKRAKELKNKK